MVKQVNLSEARRKLVRIAQKARNGTITKVLQIINAEIKDADKKAAEKKKLWATPNIHKIKEKIAKLRKWAG